jgi:5-methyltetrahydrofolate--homocysteine methyltransferase
MQPLADRMAVGIALVSDGAMGTMLFEKGLNPGQCPEKVNLENPNLLEEIARAYVDAGADIVSTNTFGGSPLKLAQYAMDDKMEQINSAAVRAARKAAGSKAYVAASIGPCGQLLEPYGDASPRMVSDNFKRQIKSILAAGVDAIFIETMTDLTEAVLAIEASRSLSPSTPVSATMTFDATPNGFVTIMGVSVEQACLGLARAGADIIGSNCGNGIENMVKIADEFIQHTSLPIIIQSNAGLPELRDGAPVYSETPEYMAENSCQLLRLGVRVIGGCCGTTPAHTAALRELVDRSPGI